MLQLLSNENAAAAMAAGHAALAAVAAAVGPLKKSSQVKSSQIGRARRHGGWDSSRMLGDGSRDSRRIDGCRKP
jgi:hypothetical protein